MYKDEILKKVEQREYEKRCVNVRICPKCGGDLTTSDHSGDEYVDKECKVCNIGWSEVLTWDQ